ncbi:MAG TPA: hypothetical protein DCL08_05165 [Anaerolineaceae bacterium]|nr:hypothetical protein [Anaerolineaceae bacterium]
METGKFAESFNSLIELHSKVAHLNIAIKRLYPIAVVFGKHFFIYDVERSAYQFRKRAPLPMPIPVGIRAAFQLEDYGGRIACVVTPEVFDSTDGYVTILHEFVHCYQYETCEQTLKMQLDIARHAQEQGNFMWEIEHPFPYTAVNFIEPYQAFLDALKSEDHKILLSSRKMLKTYLGLHDFEYMVWQEWKEGFARWVENLVKRQLGLLENKGGINPPFSRVSFYAGGEAFIHYLSKREPSLVNDLPSLFNKLQLV